MLFLQEMVGFSAIIPMLNVCFSHPNANVIGASLERVTKLLTKRPNINSSRLTEFLREIVMMSFGLVNNSVILIAMERLYVVEKSIRSASHTKETSIY